MNTEQPITVLERKKKENHKEYAYRVLRYNIMTLQLLPGTPIVESILCEQLHISRTPIHEAISKLKEESLIDVFPQRGSYISPINLNNFREGYFLRLTIEPAIIKQIQGCISEKNSQLLLDNLNRQKEITETTRDADEFLKLDNAFHKIIYEIAEKRLTWTAMRSVNSHFDRVRYMDTIINKADLNRIYQEHKWLYNILLIGIHSETEIHRFYEKHLGSFWEKFYSLLEQYPDYFNAQL